MRPPTSRPLAETPRQVGLSPDLPRRAAVAASAGRAGPQGRGNASGAPRRAPPTPPTDVPPPPSRPPPPPASRAKAAAAARMRRVRQAPAPPGVPPLPPPAAAAAATTQQPQAPPRPPPPPFPESDDDDDASLFAVEPEVLPVDPADLAAALEDMNSGSGADIGVFGDGGGGGWGEDGEWEAPPPLGDPALLLVQAESSLVGGSGGDAALAPAPGVAEPTYADPDAALAGLSGRERDARTDLLLSLATAGAGFEAALARAGPDLLDGACLRLLERRIRALKITATSPTDKAGLHTLNLLLARLTAEVARRQATPVERAMDVALRLLARPAMEVAASTGYLPQPSPFSPPPGATSDPGAPARIAAARAFLATVVDRRPGRGRGGPDRLAAEVAAALAARTGGGASAGAAATDPPAPPDLPPVWEEALLPAATLIEEAGVLVAAASAQVEELRAAARSYNSPALWAKLEEREGLVRELVVLDGLCRELAG